MQPNRNRSDLLLDLALVAFLVSLGVAARLLPHVPGILPVAASGLFAARTLRRPALALIVPLAAMVLSDFGLGGDDWRISLVVFAGIALPALAGMVWRRWHGAFPIVATMVSCSLVFFVTSNFAVWAFSGIYPLTREGLTTCYIAALPFLERTIIGDLAWTALLFGGAWLMQRRPVLSGRPP